MPGKCSARLCKHIWKFLGRLANWHQDLHTGQLRFQARLLSVLSHTRNGRVRRQERDSSRDLRIALPVSRLRRRVAASALIDCSSDRSSMFMREYSIRVCSASLEFVAEINPLGFALAQPRIVIRSQITRLLSRPSARIPKVQEQIQVQRYVALLPHPDGVDRKLRAHLMKTADGERRDDDSQASAFSVANQLVN